MLSKIWSATQNLNFLLGCMLVVAVGTTKAESGHGREDDDKNHVEVMDFLQFSSDKSQREGIELFRVGPAVIHVSQSFYGETAINGHTLVHVVPRFPGTIKGVSKTLGDSVRAGDILATVQSNESLRNYLVKAEINGVIIDQDATKGEFVTNENVLFKLANLDTTWANIAVPQKILSSIRTGTSATAVSQETDARIKSQITYVRPMLLESTRSGQARLELPNQNGEWPPGMFITVEVSLFKESVPRAVPTSSVLLIENKPSVFVQAKESEDSEGFRIRHVRVGRSDGKWVEIVDGLLVGEVVAVGNTFLLKAEMGKSSAEHSH